MTRADPLAGIPAYRQAGAMRGLGFAAYGAGVVGATLFAAPIAIDTISFHVEPETNSASLWLPWLMATLGPLALSLILWMVDPKFLPRWLPHLLFIPTSIVIYQQGMSLFLRRSGLSIHDGPAGDASALGTLYLLLTLMVHFTAFATLAIASVRSRTNGA